MPLPSVAVLVTVVGPWLNTVPDKGLDTTVTVPQLSVAVVAAKVTIAEQRPASVFCVKLVGQDVITGAW